MSMNQIHGEPNTYNAGLDFNYAVWNANTRITLANVTWNNDYRDIVRFANQGALNAYIDAGSTTTKIENAVYAKVNQPVRLSIPFNKAYKFNYLRASNPAQPIPGDIPRDFYYFITDVRYIAPETTEIIVQLDVWQTFGYDVTFGRCYIERGHIGIANQNSFQNYGRDYLAIPEGLDVGGEYRIVARKSDKVMSATNGDYNVLVATNVQIVTNPGDENNPVMFISGGSDFSGLMHGQQYYVWRTVSAFKSFLENYKDAPWITQGIVSITLVPQLTRYWSTGELLGEPAPPIYAQTPPNRPAPVFPKNMWEGWRDSAEIQEAIPERYRMLRKFYTYPYMIVEMTTWTATPIVLKPESWNDPDAQYIEEVSLVQPGARIQFSPMFYNSGNRSLNVSRGAQGQGDDGGEYADLFTVIPNLPQMAVLNNMAIQAIAGQAHSLAFSFQAADWSQQRALAGNQTGYDQATAGIGTSNELNRIGRNADTASTQLANQSAMANALFSGGAGVIGGAAGGAVGGVGGAAMGAANGLMHGATGVASAAMQQGINNSAWGIRNAQQNAATSATTGNAAYVRDTNKSLADWAARGDYENTIAGLNAKIQDARMTQPSTSGQMGGELLNMMNDRMELSMRWKMLDPSAMRVIGEYWLRYGYAVRQFSTLPASLQVMSKFTYWKLSETYVVAAGMPETFKQAIRGIFEKGVTVWAKPEYIGTIDTADNVPLTGVVL